MMKCKICNLKFSIGVKEEAPQATFAEHYKVLGHSLDLVVA